MPRTGFQAEVNGFAFVNSWQLDKGESDHMRQTLTGSAGQASNSAAGGLGGLLSNRIAPQLEEWIDAALPDYYGMCGGMAFAAADHFAAGVPLPRGRGYDDIPQDSTPHGRALRDYLWERQIQSLQLNAPQLLHWMLMLHLPLPFAGPGWLLDRAREEWAELKRHIDTGHPWPLCLIGSSISPFDNHQVLATGYDDHGDGTGVIYVYDMNSPGKEQTITIDTRFGQLAAVESVPNAERGPLRAFFCERYEPAPPPTLPDA
ncbi:hypothetical protein K2Z83_15425 [Oscillochloris sp. ZM17-4]|uniref:hypothetical protein n=1 Tax=Oscillochloris sp. ZM17-4 TaxID=2866714 RepID=UPI001C7379F0|nr:hypothetical protein [Oscillochloris sp. ZM17-4]MBX0329069.1 hypothetical protein [Oscillochloris sp. ZM17-4]